MKQEGLRAQNKKRVLDEALKCFYYEGIERTKVSTIAQKTGLTSMSVYRYYGDKESIVFESAMLFCNELVDKLLCAIDAADMRTLDGLARTKKLINIYTSIYRQNVQALMLLQKFEIYVRKRKSFRERAKVEDNYHRLAAPVYAALKAGTEDGSIRSDADCAELSAIIVNALFGAMQKLATASQSIFADKSCTPQRQLEMYGDMIINYIKAV